MTGATFGVRYKVTHPFRSIPSNMADMVATVLPVIVPSHSRLSVHDKMTPI